MNVENSGVNFGYCCINSFTVSIINNHNLVDYKNKRDEFSTSIYLRDIMDYRVV